MRMLDKPLWGYVEHIVSEQRYHSNDELKAAVTTAFVSIIL